MIPTSGKNVKKFHEVRIILDDLTWNYTMKKFLYLSNRCYDHCKNAFLPIFIATVVRETYYFIKVVQPIISPNYN